MLKKTRLQAGFSLIEIAIVLIIIGIVLGGFLNAFSTRLEQTKRKQTEAQLQEIKNALIGFALANRRLPCPSLATTGGEESPTDGSGICTRDHGFVPALTLGLQGAFNKDNLLLDSWNNPIRYSVANANGNALTTVDGIRTTTMAVLNPNFTVCSSYSLNNTDCPAGTRLVINVPFVLLSLGKDGSAFRDALVPANDQGENASEFKVTANASGENIAYTVANNRIFVSRDYGETGSTGGSFDDLITWMSIYELYSLMMQAGNLP